MNREIRFLHLYIYTQSGIPPNYLTATTMGTFTYISAASVFLVVLVLSQSATAQRGCAARSYEDGIVCVCNASYCDQPGPVELPPDGQFVVYTSSQAGQRFDKTIGTFVNDYEGEAVRVTVDRSKTYQKIFGFGGAMTDAAALNIASLSPDTQEHLLKSYYSPEGLQYNMVRVPMAGCDFSTHTYSYDDLENDVTLQHFNLSVEDYNFKIPYIKRAQELNPNRLLIFTAPWSAPRWMKTNNEFAGMGKLKTEFYELWAQYFIKFLQNYLAAGIEIWALSTQNEPTDGLSPNFTFNAMGWTADEQQDWLANNLGPALEASGFSHVRVLIMDDQRYNLPAWPNTVLGDPKARNYTSGIAVHWYVDFIPAFGTQYLDEVHDSWPEVFLLYTEACNGLQQLGEKPVALGSWERGEKYAHSIIETMNHWVTGWVDWNLALDLTGGPNWANNQVDSAVIVNATGDEFYKQPMFYTVGHFSKFVPEGSHRIDVAVETIEGTAFSTPEGATVVVLHNSLSEEVTAVVADPEHGEAVVVLPPKSLHTLVWK
ncbi:lysosomal acid glucosylceramidase [Anabrus simplex]|uniref:lysosomal acid glucosylceramidase n=1 Tax=Anabrus simplex TaxID=316456 RepID=UPI0035A321AC